MKQMLVRIISISLLTVMVGCTKSNPHPMDPLEGINREIYGFNRAVDKGIIRPVAYFYYSYTPKELQSRIHNFFGNLDTLSTIANDILQFKIAYATHDISRFLINSTIGLGGMFDPAHHLGLLKRQEDFGQTLYTWGLHDSIYVVLPLLGPSTVRDTAGMVVDAAFSVFPYIDEDGLTYGLKALEVIDIRANLLKNETVLESIGVDEYAFVRDAYLQRRAFSSFDGRLPQDFHDSDPFEDDNWMDDENDEVWDEDEALDS